MPSRFRVCFVTLEVTSLADAESFYVGILGFGVTRRFDPTRWLSLSVDEGQGGGFGLIEADRSHPFASAGTVDFFVSDLDALWRKIGDKVTVVSPPERTAWGSYKAVVKDPFGNRLGFVEEEGPDASS